MQSMGVDDKAHAICPTCNYTQRWGSVLKLKETSSIQCHKEKPGWVV